MNQLCSVTRNFTENNAERKNTKKLIRAKKKTKLCAVEK